MRMGTTTISMVPGLAQPHARGDDPPRGRHHVVGFRISPRVWGRHSAALRDHLAQLGSAPRVWGRLASVTPHDLRRSGSAPRVWGRLYPPQMVGWSETDQPHVRGDDFRLPRERCLEPRISPTCVGTTTGTMT